MYYVELTHPTVEVALFEKNVSELYSAVEILGCGTSG